MPFVLVAAVWFVANTVDAQDMTFGVEEAEQETPATEDEAEGAPDGSAEDSGGGDIIANLAADQEDAGTERETKAKVPKETVEEIYAVQQVYALRNGRLEVAPSMSFSLNDPFVSHPAPALAINYWWTNVLAVGINALWYQGFEDESDLNFFVRRSTRLAVPITEYQFGANLNFTYVPLYGKFKFFNDHIFEWDAYVVGGVGVMRTRPVPVIDPEIREFDFDWRLAFNVGLGIRVFVTRWLSIYSEVRNYAFLEQLENTTVALGDDRLDPDTWVADGASLENNVTFHLGFTIFFPFSVEYELPK